MRKYIVISESSDNNQKIYTHDGDFVVVEKRKHAKKIGLVGYCLQVNEALLTELCKKYKTNYVIVEPSKGGVNVKRPTT